MLPTDREDLKAVRTPERPDNEARLARPARTGGTLFQGWGPKLL